MALAGLMAFRFLAITALAALAAVSCATDDGRPGGAARPAADPAPASAEAPPVRRQPEGPAEGRRSDAPLVLRDATGRTHRPLDLPVGSRGAVVLFVAPECPISNAYAPEVNRLVSEYGPKGFAFYLAHCDPDVTPAAALEHAAAYGYGCPVLLDPRGDLARRLGATTTPEAAVVSPAGEVLYLGRINDLYPTLGKRRYAATTRELRDALDATLAGRPVPVPRTKAVGCTIPGAAVLDSGRKS